jgi:putative hydrolase of the HAD superfamily
VNTSGEVCRADGSPGIVIPEDVRVVVFDVVGTLVEPQPAVAQAYLQAARRHGVERDVDEIRHRFGAAWRRQEELDAAADPPFVTSSRREHDRWRLIVEDVFAGVPQTAAIFADLWEHFGRIEAWRATPAGRPLVRAALDAGATVVLASNFDERLFAIAPRIEPLCWAHHVFASSEIGWRKPAAGFFRAIEQRLGRGPEEFLIIGDDPLLDVAAALSAGWRAHRV